MIRAAYRDFRPHGVVVVREWAEPEVFAAVRQHIADGQVHGRAALLPLYRSGLRCPACDRGAFHVGRASAECAGCGLALPLAPERPAA